MCLFQAYPWLNPSILWHVWSVEFLQMVMHAAACRPILGSIVLETELALAGSPCYALQISPPFFGMFGIPQTAARLARSRATISNAVLPPCGLFRFRFGPKVSATGLCDLNLRCRLQACARRVRTCPRPQPPSRACRRGPRPGRSWTTAWTCWSSWTRSDGPRLGNRCWRIAPVDNWRCRCCCSNVAWAASWACSLVLPLWAQSLRLALAWIFISVQAAHLQASRCCTASIGLRCVLGAPRNGLAVQKVIN